jgi:hypothetical protein
LLDTSPTGKIYTYSEDTPLTPHHPLRYGPCNSHSAPFFVVLKQFWKSLLKRGEAELYTDYFMRHNPLFLWHFPINHNFP